MKTKILIFTLLAYLPIGLLAQNEKQTINNLLNDWHQAAADVNQHAYFDFIDDDGVYIGTDSTEIWTKQAFYDWSTPYFNKGKTWDFKANSRNIYISENNKFAWFDELVTNGKITLRGSGVLECKNNIWKIKHYVLSLPVPNEKFNDVRDVINEVEDKKDIEE
jgi:hypothetical protein